MSKTAKITRTVFKTEWKGNNGSVYYHEVEFDNGDKGQIGTKEKEPSKLNPGQSLTYELEVTDKGTKIKPIQDNGYKAGGGGGKFVPEDPKVKNISFAMAYTKDLIVGGKVEMKELETVFERIYKAMVSKIQ